MSGRLISLIGPPASGKTTVAHWLAGALPAELVLEDYAGNPFLAESYAGRADLRLTAQAWFLLARVNQLARAHHSGAADAVSDYAYCQDAVYAHLWLRGADLDAYRQLAERVADLIRPPSVLIHLDGPVELLAERIARRGRGYEAYITSEFLQRLQNDYNDLLARPPCPVLAVNIAERDLSQPDQQQWLLGRLAEMT